MRIIIVDDEMITRVSLKNFILTELNGYEIEGTFSNGREAADWLKTHAADIVITDIRMPKMDGLELARFIQESCPNTMVIIISGYSEFEYAKQALRYNVSSYLLKPIDFEELTASMDSCRNALQQLYSMRRDMDYSSEEYELFFIDLLTKAYSTPEMLEQHFNKMNFPFTLDKSAGVLLRLSCTRESDRDFQWSYGLETLPTALLNMVKMTFPGTHAYLVMKTRFHYDFILITGEEPGRLDTGLLLDQIDQNLHLICSIDSVYCFSSLKKLLDTRKGSAGGSLSLPGTGLKAGNKDANTDTVQDSSVIQKAIDFIETHYSMDLTREDVADAVYLSSAYFSRYFKQKTGMSFLNYLTTVRMKKAVELLGTRMKVGDIAKAVGYQSRNRFFINFRQYTSYSPTEYRRIILKMGDFNDENA